MKKTLTDSEMMELRQLGYLGGAHLADLIEFLCVRGWLSAASTSRFNQLHWNKDDELIDLLHYEIKKILELNMPNSNPNL